VEDEIERKVGRDCREFVLRLNWAETVRKRDVTERK
jgi:hypothetical protein